LCLAAKTFLLMAGERLDVTADVAFYDDSDNELTTGFFDEDRRTRRAVCLAGCRGAGVVEEYR
jgi:hypothetical protein